MNWRGFYIFRYCFCSYFYRCYLVLTSLTLKKSVYHKAGYGKTVKTLYRGGNHPLYNDYKDKKEKNKK